MIPSKGLRGRYCFTHMKFGPTCTRTVDRKSNCCDIGSHDKFERWSKDDQKTLARNVITSPLYEFVLENVTLDLAQLTILSGGKANVKTERDVIPDAVVEEQGEAEIVDDVN
jgi:hypothetical protein